MYDVARHHRQWLIDDDKDYGLFPSTDPDDPANDTYWRTFESLFRTWFAFSGLSEETVAALGDRGAKMLNGYQGFSPYADPSTGFELSYKARYGVRLHLLNVSSTTH